MVLNRTTIRALVWSGADEGVLRKLRTLSGGPAARKPTSMASSVGTVKMLRISAKVDGSDSEVALVDELANPLGEDPSSVSP